MDLFDFGESEALDATLRNVVEQDSLKWVFVGGKGGVGKTTTSCSLAIQMAKTRKNVLIISTDPAHNLSDAFRQKFSSKPVPVEGFANLSAMEIDATSMDAEATAAFGDEESGGFLRELTSSIPGIDEAMSFAEVMKQVQTMEYDCIIFDTAPTGHTLRLLQFPSLLEKGLGKLGGLKGKMGGVMNALGPLLGMPGMGDQPGAMDEITGKLDEMKAVIEKVNAQFQNPSLTTFVCVCIPEFLSLYETERLVQELSGFGIDSHNIVINQVLFVDAEGPGLLSARARMQKKYIAQFHELYDGDFHLCTMPLLSEEIRGPDNLVSFSANLVTPFEVSDEQKAEWSEMGSEELKLRCAVLQREAQESKDRAASLEKEVERLKLGR